MSDGNDLDLWARLCQMPRPFKVVDFPRKGPDGEVIGKLAIWVLTQEEQTAAAAAAQALTTKIIKETPKAEEARKGYDDVYNNVAAAELLFRACRNASNPPESLSLPAFPGTKDLREKLTVDEVGVLLNHYYSVMAELGPIVANLSEAELEALIERIARSGERFPLDLLSPEALRSLAFSLACLLRDLRKASSSPGSPPAGESSSSETVTPSAPASVGGEQPPGGFGAPSPVT